MTFSEAMAVHPKAARTLSKLGFDCARCSGADAETIEQGCLNYGFNVEELIEALEITAKGK